MGLETSCVCCPEYQSQLPPNASIQRNTRQVGASQQLLCMVHIDVTSMMVLMNCPALRQVLLCRHNCPPGGTYLPVQLTDPPGPGDGDGATDVLVQLPYSGWHLLVIKQWPAATCNDCQSQQQHS